MIFLTWVTQKQTTNYLVFSIISEKIHIEKLLLPPQEGKRMYTALRTVPFQIVSFDAVCKLKIYYTSRNAYFIYFSNKIFILVTFLTLRDLFQSPN